MLIMKQHNWYHCDNWEGTGCERDVVYHPLHSACSLATESRETKMNEHLQFIQFW